MKPEDLDEQMRALNPKRAERYFASRETWIKERLPRHVQDPFALLVAQDFVRVLSAFVKAAPKTRTRTKFCTAKCCKGKPNRDRHGPYAITEWWDTSSGRGRRGRWRTVPKGARLASTRAVEHALERAAGRPERADVGEPAEAPRAATAEDLAALREALTR